MEVEIEGGGIALIWVRDDALKSVGRYATSKISSTEDLARVASLGFRSEALHAISPVSALNLITRELAAANATRVRVVAGSGSSPEPTPAAHRVGTTVEVRGQFVNLPVRRGFLGTERADMNAS